MKKKYKYGDDAFWQHPKVKPIRKTREIKYTDTYYICPNCDNELTPTKYGSDVATMFSYICDKCGWCF